MLLFTYAYMCVCIYIYLCVWGCMYVHYFSFPESFLFLKSIIPPCWCLEINLIFSHYTYINIKIVWYTIISDSLQILLLKNNKEIMKDENEQVSFIRLGIILHISIIIDTIIIMKDDKRDYYYYYIMIIIYVCCCIYYKLYA